MCEKEDYNLRGKPNFLVYSDAKNMGQFINSNLQQVKNLRTFKMQEHLLPYDLVVEYKEGQKMAVAVYGSRVPISEENHREFRISNNDIGIKVKTNIVRRLNIRDHSLIKLAELAKDDVMYCRMTEHLEKGT